MGGNKYRVGLNPSRRDARLPGLFQQTPRAVTDVNAAPAPDYGHEGLELDVLAAGRVDRDGVLGCARGGDELLFRPAALSNDAPRLEARALAHVAAPGGAFDEAALQREVLADVNGFHLSMSNSLLRITGQWSSRYGRCTGPGNPLP